MINLQLHISDDFAEAEARLSELKRTHWEFLNPMTKGKSPRPKNHSLQHKCEKVIARLEGDDEFLDELGIDNENAEIVKKFFQGLISDNAKQLKDIILSTPNDLISLSTKLENILPPKMLYIIEGKTVRQTKLGKYISEKIFDYGAFRSSEHCIKIYGEGLNKNLHTCPYCNMKEITITKICENTPDEDKEKAYLDIDHFFPKVRYPYYAVSFFNLIPSCHDCNASEKGAKEFSLGKHVHPYVDCFDEIYVFSLDPEKLAAGAISIELNLRPAARLDETASDLKLKKRYNANLEQITAIYKWYHKYHRTFDQNREMHVDFFKSHFPDKKSNILKGCRAKLFRDVFKQIGGENLFALS